MSNLPKEPPPLCALVVAGGKSRRMGRDKAALPTSDGPLWRRTYELLLTVCAHTHVSIRHGQILPEVDGMNVPLLEDTVSDAGPMAGILTAFAHHPEHAWLVVACDMPILDRETLEHLIAQRQPQQLATAYRSNFDGLPEPLCAIYEPAAHELLRARLANDLRCPRKFLIQEEARVTLLDLPHPHALENANTPEDLARIAGMNPTVR